MSSEAIATMVRMLEVLPEARQDQVVNHLREYLADLQDEDDWDATFEASQAQLMTAARQAKQAIAEGQGSALDVDDL